MAVKYVRKGFRDGARGTHRRMGKGGLWLRPLNSKQRLAIIYLGIAGFTLLLFAAHLAGLGKDPRERPMLEGLGVVLQKSIEETDTRAPRYFLLVGIPSSKEPGMGKDALPRENQAGEPGLADRVLTDEASWRFVEEGTPLLVQYQLYRDGTRARIRSVSPIAVDGENTEEGQGTEERGIQ